MADDKTPIDPLDAYWAAVEANKVYIADRVLVLIQDIDQSTRLLYREELPRGIGLLREHLVQHRINLTTPPADGSQPE